VTSRIDEAGNLWTTLKGRRDESVLIGGHLDSVPNGGWLDGSLNIVAGLEIFQNIARAGTPEITIQLVDWADEEGARFGRSLFGSSATSGTLDIEPLRSLSDRNGITLTEAIGHYGLSLDTLKKAGKGLKNARAYLELHIEQGPVLEAEGLSLAAVLGTVGIKRHAITFTGQAAHAGTTPMSHRKDALAVAAKLSLEIREIARRHSGVCTIGSVVCKPGISSAVVGVCDILLEQRHLDANSLSAMGQIAK
jgi:N-carbamoyl-L-amino-acid hydrolase